MKSLAEARLKRARAVELAAEGKSYDEIARVTGYKHRGSAHRAVFTALGEREAEGVEDLRALELARLDALQAAIWDDAMRGDTSAARTILRIIDQRVRLLRLQRSTEHQDAYGGLKHLVVPPEGNPGGATDR